MKFTPNPKTERSSIESYFFQIFSEVRTQKPGYLEISKGYIIRLLDMLATNYQNNDSHDNSSTFSDMLFSAVNDYIKDNLQSVTINDLKEEFHFQPNYFNKLIKKYTGVTYSTYLIALRIERAKSLLESTNHTIEEIMWMVGYNNKGFFYNKFQESAGLTPSKYREKMQK